MPLVVPGLMSKDGSKDKTADWQNQLMGKKLGDTSDHTVRPPSFPLRLCRPPQPPAVPQAGPPAPKTPLCDLNPGFRKSRASRVNMVDTHQTFAKSDLPKETRVVKDGDMMTMDHKPDRYV